MGAKKGLLRGSKFNGNHTTLIEAAVRIVDAARKHPAVNKIIIGQIKQIGPGPQRIIFTKELNGYRLKVRGSVSIQVFHLYTTEFDQVEQALQKTWDAR